MLTGPVDVTQARCSAALGHVYRRHRPLRNQRGFRRGCAALSARRSTLIDSKVNRERRRDCDGTSAGRDRRDDPRARRSTNWSEPARATALITLVHWRRHGHRDDHRASLIARRSFSPCNLTQLSFRNSTQDGVVLLSPGKWPGRSMNVINAEVDRTRLDAAIDRRKITNDPAIKGCCLHIRQGRPSRAGADLDDAATTRGQGICIAASQGRGCKEAAMQAHSVDGTQTICRSLYRRLETSGKPWAAAINGALPWAARFELALSCHYRVARRSRRSPRRAAGDQGRALSRRRRHAARCPASCRPVTPCR